MKRLCLAAVVMLFAVSFAHANPTRLVEMGLQNWMFDDDSNIWFSPAYINEYANMAWVDVGFDFAYPTLMFSQWGGVSLGTLGNLGVFFNRPYTGVSQMVGTTMGDIVGVPTMAGPAVGYAGPGSFFGYPLNTLTPPNKVDFFYGLMIGPLLDLGVSVNYASAFIRDDCSLDSTASGDGYGSIAHEQSTQEINIKAAVTAKELGPIPALDIVGYVGIPTVNNSYAEISHNQVNNRYYTENISLTNAGSYNCGVDARLKLKPADIAFLVYGGWKMSYLPSINTRKRDTGATTALEGNLLQNRLYTANNINVGLAVNSQAEKFLLVCAAGFNYSVLQNSENETDPNGLFCTAKGEYLWSRTTCAIPVNIGLEYQPWGLRAGLAVSYELITNETIDPDYNTNGTLKDTRRTYSPWQLSAPVSISLGLYNQLAEGIELDILLFKLSTDLVYMMTYPYGLYPGYATQMSLTYKFK